MNTLQAGRFYILCVYLIVWLRLKLSVLCLSVLERAAQARAHTHTHTHTHTSAWETASLLRIVLSTFYYQTCPANLVTVKTAFYNNRQMIDLILTLRFGQGGTNAHRCEGKEVVLEETRL